MQLMDGSRESILSATVRSFFKTLLGTWGIAVALGIVLLVIGAVVKPTLNAPKTRLTLAPSESGEIGLLSSSSPVILKINLHGVIGQGTLTRENFEAILAESHSGILAKERVKAILLDIDSPGGSATVSDSIYQALLAYKKKYKVPVYAFVDGMCASGGMYVACAADKIYATHPSVVGSVGVLLGPAFNVYDLMEKIGVKALTLTEGKDKDMLNPFRPWKPGEDVSLQHVLHSMYQQFVDIVTTARPKILPHELVRDYGAQVYIAREAQYIGYIDGSVNNVYDVMDELAREAHIPQTEKYQVILAQPTVPLISHWFEEKMRPGKVTHQVQLFPPLDAELSNQILYLYTPGM